MLPKYPAIVRCPGCNQLSWLEDLQRVGEISVFERSDIPLEWERAAHVPGLAAEDWLLALESGLARDVQQERYLRIRIWWAFNDSYRTVPAAEHPAVELPDKIRTNMERLVAILGTTDSNELLMKAELLRELGDFESAKAVLTGIHSSDVAEVVLQLHSLCDSGDTCVRELATARPVSRVRPESRALKEPPPTPAEIIALLTELPQLKGSSLGFSSI